MDDVMFLWRGNKASKTKRYNSISNGKAVVYFISTEGMDQNFFASLKRSYFSNVILIPGT